MKLSCKKTLPFLVYSACTSVEDLHVGPNSTAP